jgi:hypothetical protein
VCVCFWYRPVLYAECEHFFCLACLRQYLLCKLEISEGWCGACSLLCRGVRSALSGCVLSWGCVVVTLCSCVSLGNSLCSGGCAVPGYGLFSLSHRGRRRARAAARYRGAATFPGLGREASPETPSRLSLLSARRVWHHPAREYVDCTLGKRYRARECVCVCVGGGGGVCGQRAT